MKKLAIVTFIAIAVSTFGDTIGRRIGQSASVGLATPAFASRFPRLRSQAYADDGGPWSFVRARQMNDIDAMKTFRPGYLFWQDIYTIPDGAVVFGSAKDGRRLAVFPTSGDWARRVKWEDPSVSGALDGHDLPKSLDDRRETVADLLAARVGSDVLHNFTRGTFLISGIERYGSMLGEWGAIYERFGVPAEIGLAQALVESGWVGVRRSEADAVGLCQWLDKNWKRLDTLDPNVLEDENQTTQAAYCGAYLSILATKYGSFIPALSEHHAGGTNIGRVLVNGERLGGREPRERYLLGSELARGLRTIGQSYSDVYGSYGPRSYRYAEMIFGNTSTVNAVKDGVRQDRIYAMRTTRAITLDEITRVSGLSADEVKRFNPALVKKVPEGATLYLPKYFKAFGRNVSFWHEPADEGFTAVLNDLVRLDATPEEWDSIAFAKTIRDFERRFAATNTDEGTVMATVLAYVRGEASSRRREILAEFRASEDIQQLFERGLREPQLAESLPTFAEAELSR